MLDITKNILLLTKSIRIKFNILAKYINKQIEITYGIVTPEDPSEWKYYLNLCGLKHSTNNDVKIKIIETNEMMSLSKELLSLYTYTKKELLKNESMYLELITNYPEDIDYIIGCLYPTTMEAILSSDDGIILTHNPIFVESNENLIEELEIYIKNIIARWHIDAYAIVEDLYLPSFLSILYSNIPSKILNIRTNNVKTSRVHSYFLEEFFNSRMYLWKDVKYLNKESIFWLYHNLDYLIKHAGKTKSLDMLVSKVFETNNVGIGAYMLYQTTPDIDTGKLINELPFSPDRSKIVTRALNNSYIVNSEEEISISKVTELQLLETDPLEGLVDNQLEKAEYLSKNIMDILSTSDKGIENTKILDIHIKDLFKINSESLLDIVINNLVHLVSENKYTGLIDYIDPNSNNSTSRPRVGTIVEYTEPNNSQTYTLTPYTGILMLLTLLLRLAGKDDVKLTYLRYYNVIDNTDDIDNHLPYLFPDGYSENILRKLDLSKPTKMDSIQTPMDMAEYVNEIVYFSELSWILDSNCENNIVSANIKHYLSRITKNGTLTISDTPKTISELLKEQGIVYDIKNSFDITSSIRELLYAFTNVKVDEYEELRLSMTAYKNILNKLTSYTTQVIDTIDSIDNKAMVYSNTPSALYSKLGLLTVLDAELHPLEKFIGILNGELNDFRDTPTYGFFNTDRDRVFIRNLKDINGMMCIPNDKFIRDDKPTNVIEILDIPTYDILHEEFKDIFFINVHSSLHPLEDNIGVTNFELNDMRDIITSTVITDNTPHVLLRNNNIIDGKAIMTTASGVIADSPTNVIDIHDIPDYDILHEEFRDIFFTNVESIVSPLEHNEIVNRLGMNDTVDLITASMNAGNNSTPYLRNEEFIIGKAISSSGSGILTDTPNNTIDIHITPDFDISLEEFKNVFFTNILTASGIDSLGTPIELSSGIIQINHNPTFNSRTTASEQVLIIEPVITGSGQAYTSFTEIDTPTNTITIE